MRTVYVNRFNRGIVNDPREQLEGTFRYIGNFDTLTNPRLLLPYRSSESGDSAPTTSQKQNFCIGYTGSAWRLFGLGRQSALNRAEILYKNLSTGGSQDLSDNGWSTPANNQSSTANPNFNFLVYYKYITLANSRIFGAENGTRIWSFDPAGSAAWDDAGHDLTYTNIAQGLVHSKDDILYIPYDNKIATNNQGSWNNTALTLPSNLYITSICEYGNYLAIACAPLSGVGNSRVYLWDRDSSITTVSESIDAGVGNIKIVEEVDGYLVVVLLSGGIGGGSDRFADRVIFKYYTPNGFVKFNMLIGATSTQLPIYKQKIDNRIYFQMSVTINGSLREGIWSIGRPSPSESLSLVHERSPNNDTALSNGNMKGFFIVGDYIFQSYQDGGNYALSKTDDSSSAYSISGVFETTINPKMLEEDRPKVKKLISAGLLYEALPAAGQAILKYKVDGGSFQTLFTETTDGVVATEFPGQDEGRDLEFQVSGTGGAKIAGLYYVYDVIETAIQ